MTKFFGYRSIIATSTGEVSQVRSISGPGAEMDDVDTTTMDSSSGFKTFVAGLGDGGDVTLDLIYDPTATVHKVLHRQMTGRTTRRYTVYHGSSTGDTDVFVGYVKGMNREIPMDDVISCEVTIKVTGLPGYTT